MRDRFYSASTGRFARRDKYEGELKNPVTLHKYNYAHNNPSNLTDPSGLTPLSEFFARYSNTLLRNFYSGYEFFQRYMYFGSIVGAAIRRDIKMQHPDVQIYGEFQIEGAGKGGTGDGRADVIRVSPGGTYEVYEIKPGGGDPASPQLTRYIEGLQAAGIPAIRGIYPFSGRLENVPVAGVRINYDLEAPGEIRYYPSINELGSAMGLFIAGIYLISQVNAMQIRMLINAVIEQAALQRGFAF